MGTGVDAVRNYPQFFPPVNFPGDKFEGIPPRVMEQRGVFGPTAGNQKTHFALSFSEGYDITVSQVKELQFMNKLAEFDDVMYPTYDCENEIIPMDTYESVTTTSVISTVFLLIKSEKGWEIILEKLKGQQGTLAKVTRLIVVLRKDEFNSVFLFAWKPGKKAFHKFTKTIVPELLVGFKDAFNRVFDLYLNKDYFIQAFIHLFGENDSLYSDYGLNRKLVFGYHPETRAPKECIPFALLLNARNSGTILSSRAKDILRSLFIENTILFEDDRTIFDSLTHLDWTITDPKAIDPAMLAFRFPKVKSLSIRIMCKDNEKVTVSLEPFHFLDELHLSEGSITDEVIVTNGNLFFPLRVLSLSNFNGRIGDPAGRFGENCNLSHVFVKELIFHGENLKESKNLLISRAFMMINGVLIFHQNEKVLKQLSREYIERRGPEAVQNDKVLKQLGKQSIKKKNAEAEQNDDCCSCCCYCCY